MCTVRDTTALHSASATKRITGKGRDKGNLYAPHS